MSNYLACISYENIERQGRLHNRDFFSVITSLKCGVLGSVYSCQEAKRLCRRTRRGLQVKTGVAIASPVQDVMVVRGMWGQDSRAHRAVVRLCFHQRG